MYIDHNVKKILIVEDDLALRPLWERFFNNQTDSIDVGWAVSCEEGLKMIHQANKNGDSYYLIITDIFLAGSGTGIELIKSPEVNKSGAKTVLISVADRDDVIKQFGYLIPETVIISKPLDFKKYATIFKKLLNNELSYNRNGP